MLLDCDLAIKSAFLGFYHTPPCQPGFGGTGRLCLWLVW